LGVTVITAYIVSFIVYNVGRLIGFQWYLHYSKVFYY
jgi:hypothetical protein